MTTFSVIFVLYAWWVESIFADSERQEEAVTILHRHTTVIKLELLFEEHNWQYTYFLEYATEGAFRHATYCQ